MYKITKNDGSLLCLLSPAELSEPTGQYWLQQASDKDYQVVCLCCANLTSPFTLRRFNGGAMHLVISPHTQSEHATGCPHSDESRISFKLGLPQGSITSKNGKLTVDFDSLFRDEITSSSGSGIWKGNQQDHGHALRAVLWLLLVRAGLTILWPGYEPHDPWADFGLSALELAIKGGPISSSLRDLLLLPAARRSDDGRRNYGRLFEAARIRQRVLVACILPPFCRVHEILNEVSFSGMFDVSMELPRNVLVRALGQSKFAMSRHARGEQVLAFGLAKSSLMPKTAEFKARAFGRVTQLILMPVGQSLTPIPTSELDHRLTQLAGSGVGNPFIVIPGDDPMMAMRMSMPLARAPSGR